MVDSIPHLEPRGPEFEVHQQPVRQHVLDVLPLRLLAEDLRDGHDIALKCKTMFKQKNTCYSRDFPRVSMRTKIQNAEWCREF